jgi:hypothetical protein
MDGSGSPEMSCPWCGADTPRPASFCGHCNAPIQRRGKLLFGLNYFAKNLLIPLVIGLASYSLSVRQQTSDRAIADHKRLVDAYIAFGQAHSDFRIAASAIGFMALNPQPTVKFNDLKDAVLRMDQAFDSIGAKLTPFEDSEKGLPGFVSRFPDGKTDVEQIWQECFILPYYADPKNGSSYFTAIGAQLRLCNGETCPSDTARGIQRIIDKIEAGRCFDGPLAGKDYKFTWFWGALERILSQQPVQAATANK